MISTKKLETDCRKIPQVSFLYRKDGSVELHETISNKYPEMGELLTEYDYQGTVLFFIPKKTYQPSAGEYLLTYIEYGSCSVCDALECARDALFSGVQDDEKANKTADAFMAICKDLVCNITKPYNTGWHEDEKFTAVADLEK